VTGAVLLGLTLYVVHDLPSSIPRNVGRHLHLALLSDNSGLPAGSIGSGTYPEHQTIRMQREARKVIRLASWDLRERFKAALEARGRAVEESEGVEKRADKAVEWFREVEDRVTLIREQMKLL
jgi:mitofusin